MENKQFHYTYTAPTSEERMEAESIQKQYRPLPKQEESKIERLRKLDKRVKTGATVPALVLGIIGTLLFGGGLSLVLELNNYPIGILLSVLGLIPVALAYFVYEKLLKRYKKKYGEEILRLSEEILHDESEEEAK